MDSWDWMVVKAYLPSILAVAGSGVGMVTVFKLTGSPFQGDAIRILGLFPIALGLYAITYAAWTTYRLWQAEHGDGLLCQCGGLLGGERAGRYGRYRRCLHCGKNVNCRYYEP